MDFKEALLKPQSQAPSGEDGYASGNEEFVDAPEKVESLPFSGTTVNDGVEKVGEVGGIENSDVKGEVNIEENEYENGAKDMENGHEVEAVEKDTVVEQGDNQSHRDMKLTPDGDSVVDSVAVKVDVAKLGVVVVGETYENDGEKAAGLKAEEDKEVFEELGEDEKEQEVDDDIEGAKVTSEGDVIVDAINADVAGPGVVVVGETEEKGNEQKDVPEVEEASGDPNKFEAVFSDAIADSEDEPKLKELVDDDVEEAKVMHEGDAIADSEDEPKLKKVVDYGIEEAKLTPEGDAIVDAINVDVAEPGMAVVGETEENGDAEKDISEGDEVSGEPNKFEADFSDAIAASKDEPKLIEVGEADVYETEKLEDAVVGEYIPVESDGGTLESRNHDEDDGEVKNREAVIEPLAEGNASDGVEVLKSVNETNQEPKDGVDVEAKQKISEIEPVNSQKVDTEAREFPISDGDDDDDDNAIFGSSEAAKKFIEELERESSSVVSAEQPPIDGQIVTDSDEEEEEAETDDEGEGKELFDSTALAALLKAATGAESSDNGSISITSQDGSRLFTVERPAGLGSSLRSLRPTSQTNRANIFSSLPNPSTGGGETEENLSEEDKKKLEKLQQIRMKFLRLVHRLGLSPEESVAAQVLYRLALLGGRHGSQTFSLDAAKTKALELESRERDVLDFSINVLVLGKSGVGKSATINSLFGEEMAQIGSFETGTSSPKEIYGSIDGVKVRVIDTPGLKPSSMEQSFNRDVLSSINKITKKNPPDVVLYVDRLDSQTRDLNDLPLLKTVTNALGSSIWRNAIVTLTHGSSAPPDGPSGTPLSYEVFVSQRSHVLQQSIGHAVGNLRMMSPSLMNPVSLVENHTNCRRNREGQKILPNGQSWRPQLLLLCYSMKILAEASSMSKPQDPFDHRKLFGFQARAPPLPYMLSSMLQSRAHPKLPSDQGGDSVDSDIDLDDLSDSDGEEVEDEYDQLPPFKPLKKAQLAKLTGEQKKAYFEEYDYRVKLLQKKQWREELKRIKEMKKKGKGGAAATVDYAEEDEADSGAAAPVAVPLPDMALPPSFDGDNPAYRYRFLEPTSQFLVRPVLDSHGWDHDCGYDGVNVEHSLAIANRFPLVYTVQVTKDKKDFSLSLDSSIATKHGENFSTMAGFDIQSMGKQMAYIVRGETKVKNLKKHKAAGGISFTFLGENVVPGIKIEDQVSLGRQYVIVGSAGAVKSQSDTALGANFELQRREADYPIGQVQSSVSMSIVKWRGDLAMGFNGLAQLSVGRNSKVAVRAGINNKRSGQITVRTSSSEHLSLALAAVIPTALSIYRKLFPVGEDKYSIY